MELLDEGIVGGQTGLADLTWSKRSGALPVMEMKPEIFTESLEDTRRLLVAQAALFRKLLRNSKGNHNE